jgi:hypothetical protein
MANLSCFLNSIGSLLMRRLRLLISMFIANLVDSMGYSVPVYKVPKGYCEVYKRACCSIVYLSYSSKIVVSLSGSS